LVYRPPKDEFTTLRKIPYASGSVPVAAGFDLKSLDQCKFLRYNDGFIKRYFTYFILIILKQPCDY